MNEAARRNDRELFEAVVSGDSEAFAELAGRHARGLYDFALRGTQDEQQAVAAVESVFRRIREPGLSVPSQIDLRTWLYSLGLVDVLAVASETRTARISTDDERFFERTTNVDLEVAHSAWQAARGLRTRDYCVLDLTLRRGLTPEEVAEAASLTKSNLYASIGRARGAFEETFAAVVLFEHGRDVCADLDDMVEGAPGASLRPALRHQIIEHADDCETCRLTLQALPPAAGVYVSLADVEMPEAVIRRILLAEPDESQAATDRASAAVSAGVTDVMPLASDDRPESAAAEAVVAPLIVAGVIGDEAELPQTWEEEPQTEEALVLEFEERETGEAPVEAEPSLHEAVFGRLEIPSEPATLVLTAEEPPDSGEQGSWRDQVAVWVTGLRNQPMLWTYAVLGVSAVLAIYVGFAVANSLQSGGGDAGAVPLDTAPGITANRAIDCGSAAIELNAGETSVVSFDENELDGYSIQTLSFAPVSAFASFEDLEATLEGPFSILFLAKPQATSESRTEEFELRILWQRGGEVASSACLLSVHLEP